jgi:hypothetical protein
MLSRTGYAQKGVGTRYDGCRHPSYRVPGPFPVPPWVLCFAEWKTK